MSTLGRSGLAGAQGGLGFLSRTGQWRTVIRFHLIETYLRLLAYAVERNDTLELNANVVDFQNLGLQRRALYFRNREWTECRSGLGVARSVWGWRQRLDGASLGVKTARACSADTCFNTSADDYFALEP